MLKPEVCGDKTEGVIHDALEHLSQAVANVLLQFVHHLQRVLVQERVYRVTYNLSKITPNLVIPTFLNYFYVLVS